MCELTLFDLFVFFCSVPSKAPSAFQVFSINTSAVRSTWRLPPADSRHGIITGFKLFFRSERSADDGYKERTVTVSDILRLFFTEYVTGLEASTKYEFQVLAYTIAGDGPKSAVKLVTTFEEGKYTREDFRFLRFILYLMISELLF